MFQSLLFKFVKPFLTPEKIIPIVFDWLMAEWARSKYSVATFIYQSLAQTKLKDTATQGEMVDFVTAVEGLLKKASKLPEWGAAETAFKALFTVGDDSFVGPRLTKK